MNEGNLFIKNAAQLVTCSGFSAKRGGDMLELGVIEHGAVVVEKGIIRAVGPSADLQEQYEGDDFLVLDASGKAVLPGFIDAHTHFLFAGERAEEFAWRIEGLPYMEILARGGGILSTVKATRACTKEELFLTGLKRLNRMLSFGVTTLEGKSGYGLDLETEIRQLSVMRELEAAQPVEIVRTFLGAHVPPPEYSQRTDRYINYIAEEVLPIIARESLAQFCDVFCEHNVFSVEQSRRLLSRAKEFGLGVKLHADEMASLGGAELAAEIGALSADHLLKASDGGIERMARAGVIGVLLPGTAFCLKSEYARARFMIDHGMAVALATDFNPGTFFSESISLVCALAVLHMGMRIEEVVTAITINAAAAIGRADRVGSVDIGKQGDLVILEHPSYTYIPYHTGVSSVESVIKKGRVVFRKTQDHEQPVR
jgi:imidazolonepropionase